MMPWSIKRLLAGLITLMLLITSVASLTAFGEEPPLPATSLETIVPPAETSSDLPSDSSVESSPPPQSSLPEGSLPLGLSGLEPSTLPADDLLAMGYFDYCNISADVSFDKVNPANGDLIVTLKLERLNVLGNTVTNVWYETLRYTDGMGSRNFQFLDLPSGRYRLTQLPVMRYSRQRLTKASVSGNVVNLDSYSVTFDLWLFESSGYAAFHNKRTTDNWFTHTDMAVNHIYLPARGGGCDDDYDN